MSQAATLNASAEPVPRARRSGSLGDVIFAAACRGAGIFVLLLLGAIIAVPLIGVVWSVYSELHVKDSPVVGDLPAYGKPS